MAFDPVQPHLYQGIQVGQQFLRPVLMEPVAGVGQHRLASRLVDGLDGLLDGREGVAAVVAAVAGGEGHPLLER